MCTNICFFQLHCSCECSPCTAKINNWNFLFNCYNFPGERKSLRCGIPALWVPWRKRGSSRSTKDVFVTHSGEVETPRDQILKWEPEVLPILHHLLLPICEIDSWLYHSKLILSLNIGSWFYHWILAVGFITEFQHYDCFKTGGNVCLSHCNILSSPQRGQQLK